MSIDIPVLVTQCLQHDFVGPMGATDSLPNALHVGRDGSSRLLGMAPPHGPLAGMLRWAGLQERHGLHVFHVRDWHDKDDPLQREHLKHFKHHCIRDTHGARFIFEDWEGMPTAARVIDSTSLSDLQEGTALHQHLDALDAKAKVRGRRLKIAVVGVLADVKVHYLLYELSIRYPEAQFATCDALIASLSGEDRRHALRQMERNLRVEVLKTVQSLQCWLVVSAGAPDVVRPVFHQRPVLSLDGDALDETDADLVADLFREAASVKLSELRGGFGKGRVFRAECIRASGLRESPSVLKLGPGDDIAAERLGSEAVAPVIGNHAPRVQGYAQLGARGGLRFAYASMGSGKVQTLKEAFRNHLDPDKLEGYLRNITSILGPLYRAAHYEPVDLLMENWFDSFTEERVLERVAGVLATAAEGVATAQGTFVLGGHVVPDVRTFYEVTLKQLKKTGITSQERHLRSLVHGDLNYANILIDGNGNEWLIDFSHARPCFVLTDFAKLENDLLHVLTDVGDETVLGQAIALSKAALDVQDLRQELAEMPPAEVTDPGLGRAWRLLRVIRECVAKTCQTERSPVAYWITLLRYAVHSLEFPEPTPYQKMWALATAGMLSEAIRKHYEVPRDLRVDWLPLMGSDKGRLGMTLCPGRRDRGRQLQADVAAIRAAGANVLVCLLQEEELERVGAEDLQQACLAVGIGFRQLPIPDQGVPAMDEAKECVGDIRESLARGECVVLHGMGGLGRTGLMAASVAIEAGMDPEEAIALAREARRDRRVVESEAQAKFVQAYAEVRQ